MDRKLANRLGVFGTAVVVGSAMGVAAPVTSLAVLGTALSGVSGGIMADDLRGVMDGSLGDATLRNAHLT